MKANRSSLTKTYLLVVLAFGLSQAEIPTQPLVDKFVTFSKGKTYKRNPSSAERAMGKYDCTTFVEAALSEAGYALNVNLRAMINIVLSSEDASRLKQLVENKDSKIQGVVNALVSSKQGTLVTELSALQPGDIVQIWRPNASSANGHAAIVKSVVGEGRYLMIGAHNERDGVGEKEFVLGTEEWPVWFAVRPLAR